MKKRRFNPVVAPAENAAALLPPMFAAWCAAGRKVASEDPVAKDLHRFRIEGKRLRYTMELFEPCYGPELKQYLELLKKAQTNLGDFQDCAVVTEMLERFPAGETHVKRARQYLARRSKSLYGEFRKFWRESVDGLEKKWAEYLATPAVQTAPSRSRLSKDSRGGDGVGAHAGKQTRVGKTARSGKGTRGRKPARTSKGPAKRG